jgi:hypothetical protein
MVAATQSERAWVTSAAIVWCAGSQTLCRYFVTLRLLLLLPLLLLLLLLPLLLLAP